MAAIITILIVIFGLMFSISLHELGHMLPAKFFKVPTPEYMVGFGPKLWSTKKGETEYGIKAIWLGGYTTISGMYAPKPKGYTDKGPFKEIIEEARIESAKSIPEGQESRSFYTIAWYKKILVMAGGILTNLLLAFIFFAIAFCGLGANTPNTEIAEVQTCISGSLCEQKSSADPDLSKITAAEGLYPSAAAKLQPGDKIDKIGDKPVNSFEEIQAAINASQGKPITFAISRGDAMVFQEITPVGIDDAGQLADSSNAVRYIIGYTPGASKEYLSLGESIEITASQIVQTMAIIPQIPIKLYESVVSLFTGADRGNGSLLSVVGLGQIAVNSANNNSFSDQVYVLLSLLGSLNVALFVFNLIPLLPLDGGHVANALYEGLKRLWFRIKGKPKPGPVDAARTVPISLVCGGFLILMMIVTVLVDIINPLSL